MIGFMLKKWFYDLWDNMLVVALLNIGFLVSLAVPFIAPSALSAVPILAYAVAIAGILWCSTYLIASAMMMNMLSDGGSFTFRDFFVAIKGSWRAGMVSGIIMVGVAYCILVAIPFYLGSGSTLGLVASATLFWMILLLLLAMQFYPALRSRNPGMLGQTTRKCLELFFDNTIFSFIAAVVNLVLMAASFFVAFMLPGPAGCLLLLDEAVRLRMMKYDYLAANPTADRKRIPWDVILAEEKELTGTRSLKNLIFPWKD
jgi:hypothetical protein